MSQSAGAPISARLGSGAAEAMLGATREELEAVPGVPAKVGRDLYHHLNKTGR